MVGAEETWSCNEAVKTKQREAVLANKLMDEVFLSGLAAAALLALSGHSGCLQRGELSKQASFQSCLLTTTQDYGLIATCGAGPPTQSTTCP